MKLRIYISCLVICLFLLVTTPADAQNTTPHFGLELGTSFGTAGAGTSLFSHSLAPSLSWDISKNFQFVAGTILTSARMNGLMSQYGSNGHALFVNPSTVMQSTTVYAFGVYHLNQRLSITGGTWFERAHFDMQESFLNPYTSHQNPQGVMLGLDYRVNENLRFGIEVNASRGVSPFYPTSFQHSPFHGNFNTHRPFHRYTW